MRYLNNIWKIKNKANADLKTTERTLYNNGSSEIQSDCNSNCVEIKRTTTSESEFTSEGSRISLFSVRKDKFSNSDVEKYNRNGISPLELDQSLNMRAYRMSMYIM